MEEVVEQAVEEVVEQAVEEVVVQAVVQTVEQVLEAVEAEEAVEEVVEVQRRQTFKLRPRLAGPVFQGWWLHPHASLELKSPTRRPRLSVRLSVQRHRNISS